MARRLLVLATPVAMLVGGLLIFYVFKDLPAADCGSPARIAVVEDYRRGLGAYGSFCAIALGALLGWVSRGHRTRAALIACGWLVLVYNVENSAFEPHATTALLVAVFGGELLLVASALGVVAMRRPRVAELTYLWTVLLVFLPAAVGWVAAEHQQFICFD